MSISRQEALDILNRDPIKNIAIINFLEARPDAQIRQFGESLVVGTKGGVTYISCQDDRELEQIVASLGEEELFFASLEGWMTAVIKGDREASIYPHQRFVLYPDVALPEAEHAVSPLAPEHRELVAHHWLEGDPDERGRHYVLTCLAQHPTAAIYVNGNPVSWAGIHEDGALGFLHTIDEHRGKGYALSITLNLIEQQRAQGKIPFVNIEEGRKSLGLAQKLGFVPVGHSCWLDFGS